MITMLATRCHLAIVAPNTPIEICEEKIMGRKNEEASPEALTSCFMQAQMVIAPMIPPGYTVHEIRCASDKDGKDRPKDAI